MKTEIQTCGRRTHARWARALRSITLVAICLLQISFALAQSASPVTGYVRDKAGLPVIGATVLVDGTQNGTATNAKGWFSIEAAPTDRLAVSFVGYKTATVAVGSRSQIDITLEEDATSISEVVVTALGLSRETKSLSYNVQKVDGEELVKTKDANIMNSLAGKIPGVQINASAAGIGGGTRVVMRGTKSISGNNNALYVVDGIPLSNLSSEQPDDQYTGAGQTGDAMSAINADDIESVSVLNGSAAAALYGSAAANGVVIITTKKGSADRTSVTYSNNSTFYSPFVLPKFQNTYGSETGEWYSWNAQKMSSPTDYSVEDFFQTGWTATNSLSVSGKINKNNSIRLSVTDYRSESIVPNSPWSKQSMSLKSHNKVNKWFTMDTSFTYYRRDNDNLPVMGYGSSSIMYSLWCMAPNINMDWAKQYWLPGQEHVQQDAGLSGGKNNPYFTAYELLNTLDRDRAYGNTTLNLHLYKGLDLMIRGGMDFSRDLRTSRHPKSSYSYKYGMYNETKLTSLQLSGDFMLKYDRKLGAGFNLTANLGGSIINRSFVQTIMTAEQLKQPGIYSLANSVNRIKTDNYAYERQTNSIYGLVSLSWRDAVYLDITGRNDWSSTLPVNNNSYFYPSVSASVC